MSPHGRIASQTIRGERAALPRRAELAGLPLCYGRTSADGAVGALQSLQSTRPIAEGACRSPSRYGRTSGRRRRWRLAIASVDSAYRGGSVPLSLSLRPDFRPTAPLAPCDRFSRLGLSRRERAALPLATAGLPADGAVGALRSLQSTRPIAEGACRSPSCYGRTSGRRRRWRLAIASARYLAPQRANGEFEAPSPSRRDLVDQPPRRCHGNRERRRPAARRRR